MMEQSADLMYECYINVTHDVMENTCVYTSYLFVRREPEVKCLGKESYELK
jgi:hypothetical protein